MELTQPQYNKQKNEVKEAITNCRNGMLVIDLKSVYSEDLEDCQLDVSEINTTITNLNILISKCDGEIVKIKKAINALNVWAKALSTKRNDIMTNILIESSNIVGATCIGINSNREFTDVKFDVSIIDEAGQIQIHNAIVPMSRSRKTLMLGDHLQIPPMVNNNMAQMCKDEEVETELLEKSFFEYLFENLKKKDSNTPNLTRLNEQFRMPSNISDVISEWFYECNYHANYDMSKWKPLIPGTKTPLVIVSTSGEKERMEYSENDAKKDYSMGKKVEAALNGPGYANRLEAKIVVDIVEALIKSGVLPTTDSKGRPLEVQDNIGIISAYGKQVRYIRSALSKRNLGLHNDQIYSMCASLDSFQGQERPIIIYSSTRSTNYKGVDKPRVGFMKELRRLNVAFTRCQKQLVIIGDINYLTSCEYQELNEETREPLANKSEKKYSEFISKIVEQAKTSQGEYVDYSKLDQMLGGEE
jgi:superfamily I DNA and/or RNA helicase